jgi:hypothetical protein
LLGHSRIDTTAHYTAVSPQIIAGTLTPLDRLDQPAKRPTYPERYDRRSKKKP